jgi:hypothetical protein
MWFEQVIAIWAAGLLGLLCVSIFWTWTVVERCISRLSSIQSFSSLSTASAASHESEHLNLHPAIGMINEFTV